MPMTSVPMSTNISTHVNDMGTRRRAWAMFRLNLIVHGLTFFNYVYPHTHVVTNCVLKVAGARAGFWAKFSKATAATMADPNAEPPTKKKRAKAAASDEVHHSIDGRQHHTEIQPKLELPQLKWEWALQTCIFHNFRFPLSELRQMTECEPVAIALLLIIRQSLQIRNLSFVLVRSPHNGNLKLWKIQVCELTAHSHLSWGNSSFRWITVWCCFSFPRCFEAPASEAPTEATSGEVA